jgi:K+-sensing histidine kinase KdpD
MKAVRDRMRFSEQVQQLASKTPALRNPAVRNTTMGFLLCIALAAVVSGLLRTASGVESLPLLFLMIVAVVAHRFGTSGAILGLIGGSVVFAIFLFPPVGHLSIANEQARTNVVLMVLFGIAVSYFYGAATPSENPEEKTRRK